MLHHSETHNHKRTSSYTSSRTRPSTFVSTCCYIFPSLFSFSFLTVPRIFTPTLGDRGIVDLSSGLVARAYGMGSVEGFSPIAYSYSPHSHHSTILHTTSSMGGIVPLVWFAASAMFSASSFPLLTIVTV